MFEKSFQNFLSTEMNFLFRGRSSFEACNQVTFFMIICGITGVHPNLANKTPYTVNKIQIVGPELQLKPTYDLQCTSHLNGINGVLLARRQVWSEGDISIFKDC